MKNLSKLTGSPAKGETVDSEPASTDQRHPYDEDLRKAEVEAIDHGADTQLHRTLGTRHLTMVALGSSIGMGMWLGSGTTLVKSGPAALFIGFVIASSIVWAVNHSIGELAVLYPLPSAFVQWSNILVSPAAGFALGWGYWMSYWIAMANELQAIVTILNFWTDGVPKAVWITIFWMVIVLINVWAVKFFAEVEVIASTLKFSWMIVVIISFIVITAGGAPQGDSIGFRYWSEEPFINGFRGFLNALPTCVFAMAGTESVSFVAHEVANPQKSMPKAIKSIWLRLGIFYILGSLMVTLVVSPNNPHLFGHHGSNGSRFVVAYKSAGIPVMAQITNAIIFISVLSTGSITAYGGSRILVGLSYLKMTPRVFGKADRLGRPWAGYIATMGLGGALAYINVSQTGADVFTWLSHLVSLLQLVGWSMICFCNLRLRYAWRTQGRSEADLPWRSPFTPYAQWWGLICCLILIVIELYLSIKPLGEETSAKNFFANFVSIIAVMIIWVTAQIWYRCPILVDASKINLDEFRRFYATHDDEEGEPRGFLSSMRHKAMLVFA